MGRDSILNKKQKLILGAFGREKRLSSVFYLSGGTALSEYYLKHRKSVDLVFFCREYFNPGAVLESVNAWSGEYGFISKYNFIDPVHIYFLEFKDGEKLKIDFARYPYPQLEKPTRDFGVVVDSCFDISVNKLLLISQRTEVKDFVDLYFILKKFNFWQLRDGLKAKFNVETEPYLAAMDYTKVKDFEIMPEMQKELSLKKLKEFFMDQAEKLGRKAVG